MKKGLEPSDENFWIDLKDSCGLTIEEAKRLATDVRNRFLEDVKLISNRPNQLQSGSSLSDEILELTYAQYGVKLPKNNPEEIWPIIEAMVNAALSARKKEIPTASEMS